MRRIIYHLLLVATVLVLFFIFSYFNKDEDSYVSVPVSVFQGQANDFSCENSNTITVVFDGFSNNTLKLTHNDESYILERKNKEGGAWYGDGSGTIYHEINREITLTKKDGEVLRCSISVEQTPTKPQLFQTAWQLSKWVVDGEEFIPENPEEFVTSFERDNATVIQTDCNTNVGSFEARDDALSLKLEASTRMFCDGSVEDEYVKLLQKVTTYNINDDGILVLQNPEGLRMDYLPIVLP